MIDECLTHVGDQAPKTIEARERGRGGCSGGVAALMVLLKGMGVGEKGRVVCSVVMMVAEG